MDAIQPVNECCLCNKFADAFLAALGDSELQHLKSILNCNEKFPAFYLQIFPELEPLCEKLTNDNLEFLNGVRNLLLERIETSVNLKSMPEPDISERYAYKWLRKKGGIFAALTKGVQVATEIDEQLPESLIQNSISIGLFKVVTALKLGKLVKADAMMSMISETYHVPALDECNTTHSPEMVCVLFMKAVYSDADISERATDNLLCVLSQLSSKDSLLKAVLYNVALDVFYRKNDHSMAQQLAQRSIFHYNAANEEGGSFYVFLYLVLMALKRGDIDEAINHSKVAEKVLKSFAGATSNDAFLLTSVRLICAYELGEADAFITHLVNDEQSISYGEIWPSIAAPLISYGRLALRLKVSSKMALAWVRKWRFRQRRDKRFDLLVSTQEALALQDMGRWQEADDVLSNLHNDHDIDFEIAKLFAKFDRRPHSETLIFDVQKCTQSSGISARQFVQLTLLGACCAASQGDFIKAVKLVRAACETTMPSQVSMLWKEQKELLDRLVAVQGLKKQMMSQPALWRQIETYIQPRPSLRPAELTQQEYRILLLLAEKQSNKSIAQRLGISEATVKFHVGNLIRKTGQRKRAQVVAFAMEQRWIQ